ncbi:MAG TPA: radical SAM protein [Desulfosporosinus sp.]|nr:radical SAM protein [Desulfosporosinus sp.]
MVVWKCSQCRATSEGRCSPKACPPSVVGKDQIVKAE